MILIKSRNTTILFAIKILYLCVSGVNKLAVALGTIGTIGGFGIILALFCIWRNRQQSKYFSDQQGAQEPLMFPCKMSNYCLMLQSLKSFLQFYFSVNLFYWTHKKLHCTKRILYCISQQVLVCENLEVTKLL